MSNETLKARVISAGEGTYVSAEYSCYCRPSLLPYYVELTFCFHAIDRDVLYMWCAEEEGNPALLSIEKKEAAYATLMRIMETEHNGVEDILAKLQRSSTRPEAELRPMAEALQSREWEKTKAAIDTVWEHINRALAKTATGSITDISLEDAKIVAKGIMEGRLGPYHLEPYVRKAEPELAKADEKKEKEVEKPVGGEEKEEEGQKKPGKNAKRNAARKTARKLKRDEQTAADVNLAEGLGERESSTSNQI